MVYACRTSCARSITGVLPYFPYSKQCKMRKRGSIVSKLIASMMCKAGKRERVASQRTPDYMQSQPVSTTVCVCAGLTHLITMDLHQKEIQGFFNIPVDNLRASPFLLQYIQEEVTTHEHMNGCAAYVVWSPQRYAVILMFQTPPAPPCSGSEASQNRPPHGSA